MKKVLKIIILVSVIMVMCSMSNFTYATEEDGRFVDIPVPPSSSGRADFTSEEANEQSKTYEESKNDSQQNSEILGQNSILYKGTETTTQNVTEEKQEEEKQEQQENVEEQPKDENYIDNIVEEENKIDNIEKTDNNSSNIKFILIGILVVILILIILKKSTSKKNKEKRKRK